MEAIVMAMMCCGCAVCNKLDNIQHELEKMNSKNPCPKCMEIPTKNDCVTVVVKQDDKQL